MPSLPSFAYPGLLLGETSSYNSGPGTYTIDTTIYASLSGKPHTSPANPSSKTLPTLSITHSSISSPSFTIPSRNVTRHNILPAVNSIVLARVTRLQERQANVAILIVGEYVCADAFAGVVRREDVRGWEVDKVKIEESFRVGDLVRGVVISLGDQASYYLSTARNELGVLLATSEAGNSMYPISWKEFRDPITGQAEVRKVAKPI